MSTGRILRDARRRAGFTQRELASRARVPQASVARIEKGTISPTVATLDRLLEACGRDLTTEARLGIGIDRTAIRERLELTTAQRVQLGAEEAHALLRFEHAVARSRRGSA